MINNNNPFTKENINSRSFTLEKVKENGNYLYFASEKFKADEEIVMVAYENKIEALAYASNTLLTNKTFAEKVLITDGYTLKYFHELIKNDYNLVKIAINKYPEAFKFASNTIKNDETIALESLRLQKEKNTQYSSGMSSIFQATSESLKNDKSFLLKALEISPSFLSYIQHKFKKDPSVVQLIANKHPMSMKELDEEFLFQNPQFYLQALEKDASIFKDIPLKVRNHNREICIKAVKLNDTNIASCSAFLHKDEKFLDQIVPYSPGCITFIVNEVVFKPKYLIPLLGFNALQFETMLVPGRKGFSEECKDLLEKALKKQKPEYFSASIKCLDSKHPEGFTAAIPNATQFLLRNAPDSILKELESIITKNWLKTEFIKEFKRREILNINRQDVKKPIQKSRKLKIY
jgi:hypothetical protein